jgi:hypothetical protein
LIPPTGSMKGSRALRSTHCRCGLVEHNAATGRRSAGSLLQAGDGLFESLPTSITVAFWNSGSFIHRSSSHNTRLAVLAKPILWLLSFTSPLTPERRGDIRCQV